MKKEQETVGFEARLETLEQITEKMEEGKLDLAELMKLYEQGIKLSEGLKKDLELAQTTLTELKDGKLKPVEGEA
ncbi:MAG: exodeoxyribonuclease VII small subunit [Clostridiales bacterium]|nr:exodeoxyribonuclease VII small subunit [Clostridiales bacterium]